MSFLYIVSLLPIQICSAVLYLTEEVNTEMQI